MTPPKLEAGFVRMPEDEFEAMLARAAEQGARRALANVGLDGPESVVDAAIEGNPFAEAIICLIVENGPWEGTATDLLRVLKTQYPLLADDPQCLPKSPPNFVFKDTAIKKVVDF